MGANSPCEIGVVEIEIGVDCFASGNGALTGEMLDILAAYLGPG